MALSIGAAPAAADDLPVIYNGVYGYAALAVRPRARPAPTTGRAGRARRTRGPVVLVHGTFADHANTWQRDLAAARTTTGYCVFALNYGSYAGSGRSAIYGLGDIRHVRASS